MCLKASFGELPGGQMYRVGDGVECPFAGQVVVYENEIEVDRQPRHIANEEIDRCPSLKRKGLAGEDEGSHLGKQASSVEVDLVHALSTNRPSADRETQGLLLPVGSLVGSSLAAQGSELSLPSCRHRRTVFTLVQRFSRSRNTSARML